jgi:hypothetical protein
VQERNWYYSVRILNKLQIEKPGNLGSVLRRVWHSLHTDCGCNSATVTHLTLLPLLNSILLSSGLLRSVRCFNTDVSELHTGSVFKETALSLKMVHTGSPETSVLNHLAPRNVPEDGRIQARYCFDGYGGYFSSKNFGNFGICYLSNAQIKNFHTNVFLHISHGQLSV